MSANELPYAQMMLNRKKTRSAKPAAPGGAAPDSAVTGDALEAITKKVQDAAGRVEALTGKGEEAPAAPVDPAADPAAAAPPVEGTADANPGAYIAENLQFDEQFGTQLWEMSRKIPEMAELSPIQLVAKLHKQPELIGQLHARIHSGSDEILPEGMQAAL